MNELKEQAKKRYLEVLNILKVYNIDKRAILIYKNELVKESGEFNRESEVDYEEFVRFMKLEDTPKLKKSFELICTPGEDSLELRHLLCLMKNSTLADNNEKL